MEQVNINYKYDETSIFIHANSNDYIGRMIKWNKNFYEYELLSFLENNFNNQKNIIDIGANIGNHSLFFSKYMKCDKIYAFEPFQKNIEIFKRNLSNYKDKCILFETALSNIDGKMIMYNTEHDNFGGFSLYKQSKSFEVCNEIDVVKLDNYDFNNVTLLKIDVENHENEVLIGAKQTILKNKPVIVLENSYYFFSHIFPNPEPHKEILEELEYIKLHSNVCNSSMDIWGPRNI